MRAKTINVIINCVSYCIPTVRTTKINVDRRNAILGLKNIAAMIITAGIGSIYGEDPVGSTTAIVAIIVVNIPARDRYLVSKKSFSKNFRYARNVIVINKTSIYIESMPCQLSS